MKPYWKEILLALLIATVMGVIISSTIYDIFEHAECEYGNHHIHCTVEEP